MIKEKRKKGEEELGGSVSLDRTPSPLSCHGKWKRAHQRKDDEFTSDATREVAQRIDDPVEQTEADLFTSQDRHDILIEAIGTEEHLGCVRGLGRGIGFKEYFRSSK
ncbi:unnamed protein product [Lathyrus oleraceus]